MIVSVTYPLKAGNHFDLDYYLSKHMPLVQKHWGPMGLRGAQVVRGTSAPDGGAPPVTMMVLLDFESAEAFGKAAAAHGAEIMGDVAKFTDIRPVMQFNEVLG